MGLVTVVLVAAVAIGRLLGGRLPRLAALDLPNHWLVLAAVGVQGLGWAAGAAGLPAGPAYSVALGVSALLVLGFLAGARGVAGLGLVALGLGLNATVVAANGGMPVSAEAATRAGADDGALAAGPRHVPLDGDTRLPWAADVIAVPLPLRPEVVSAGDVAVAAGLGRFVVVGMRARGRAPNTARVRRPPRAVLPGRPPRAVLPGRPPRAVAGSPDQNDEPSPGGFMAKKARKRKGRKKSAANHGKRPNA